MSKKQVWMFWVLIILVIALFMMQSTAENYEFRSNSSPVIPSTSGGFWEMFRSKLWGR